MLCIICLIDDGPDTVAHVCHHTIADTAELHNVVAAEK